MIFILVGFYYLIYKNTKKNNKIQQFIDPENSKKIDKSVVLPASPPPASKEENNQRENKAIELNIGVNNGEVELANVIEGTDVDPEINEKNKESSSIALPEGIMVTTKGLQGNSNNEDNDEIDID